MQCQQNESRRNIRVFTYHRVSMAGKGRERIYYIHYRRQGRKVMRRKGWLHADDMTEAKANTIRSDRIRGKELSNEQRREAQKDGEA